MAARFWLNSRQPLKMALPFEAVIGIGTARFKHNAVAAGNQVNKNELISNPPAASFTPYQAERKVV
jgi:hypothetical protein